METMSPGSMGRRWGYAPQKNDSFDRGMASPNVGIFEFL